MRSGVANKPGTPEGGEEREEQPHETMDSDYGWRIRKCGCEQHEPASVVEGDHTHRVNDLIQDASKKRVSSRVGHSAPFILVSYKNSRIVETK